MTSHDTSPPTTPPAPTRRGSRVEFSLARTVDLSPERAWAMLVDWPGHAEWVPMTSVEVDPEDPNRFTAWSGLGRRLALEDRMVTVEQTFDGEHGRCLVHKLGPVLVGEAEFTVAPGPTSGTAVVHWREDVHVPYLPGPLSGLTGRIGALLFAQALRRMERLGRRTS
ncbi:MAG: SRPBCC family protein [Ilumatobacteraceae bacterium]|jgi:hypothetical protein